MTTGEPHRLPVDGTLDLHTFQPAEIGDVVEAYIEACLENGVFALRIIHGKGRGVQRETVRRLLQAHPDVESFRTVPGPGSWGVTLVNLKRRTAS